MFRVTVVAALAACVLAACSARSQTARHGHAAAQRPVAAAPVVAAPVSAAPAPAPAPMAAPARGAKPPPNPCAHNESGRLVRVSLRQQQMWLCTHRHLAYSAPITSGVVGQYTSTPTGDYAIQGLNRNTVLTLITGQQYTVKYWIPFDAPLFGFHDSSWQRFPYGSPKYKSQGSHGCVHLPLKAIRYLYHWADIGTPVRIRA